MFIPANRVLKRILLSQCGQTHISLSSASVTLIPSVPANTFSSLGVIGEILSATGSYVSQRTCPLGRIRWISMSCSISITASPLTKAKGPIPVQHRPFEYESDVDAAYNTCTTLILHSKRTVYLHLGINSRNKADGQGNHK